MTVQPIAPEPALSEPALVLVPTPPAEQPTLLVRILDAEDELDEAMLALVEAAKRVESAERALGDLMSVKDDA
jgi:hypothetical protein